MARGFAIGRVLGYLTWCACYSLILVTVLKSLLQVFARGPSFLVEVQASLQGWRWLLLLLLLFWKCRSQ
jgi:hypothetical protein